jgi:pimeloyl-ACP methyl ester carboxylesterase
VPIDTSTSWLLAILSKLRDQSELCAVFVPREDRGLTTFSTINFHGWFHHKSAASILVTMSKPEPIGADVQVNGVRLRYLDWGGTGEPIVLLHATGLLGRIYQPIIEDLRQIGRVYTYDQRGHGDSGTPRHETYSWDDTVKDLKGFLETMGLRKVRGIGHSAGGTAIGVLSGLRPDLISRAVLMEPVLFDETVVIGRPDDLRERTLKRKRSFDSVGAMFANFKSKPPYNTWRKGILHAYCEYGTKPDAEGRRELKCDPLVEAQFYATAGEFNGLERLLRSEQPLLVMIGERSESPAIWVADKLEHGLKHGLVRFPDNGHFLPMEDPDTVAKIAIEFFLED